MEKKNISIIGLGYVGLPLAIGLGKFYKVTGFDTNKKRILELKNKIDITKEINIKDFKKAKKLNFTYDLNELRQSNYFIVTVPTPLKEKNKPDLKYIHSALITISKVMSKKSTIVLESTVYPGFCDEYIRNFFEKKNKFLNRDFFLGYSPERINPGNSKKKLSNIVKIVSASDNNTLKNITKIYSKVIKAGIYKAPNIKVAEAAKVIENIQRDVNIALINEFSIIFKKMNIDTNEVLKAASTKWNFLNFKPGLVGGHCIGVDPYYLTHKCKKLKINPKLILSGRSINNSIPKLVTAEIINKISKKKLNVRGLIMGLTFKENCNDVRNSGSYKIYKILNRKYNMDVYDPIAIKEECLQIYKKNYVNTLKENTYDFVLIAVKHDKFKSIGVRKIRSLCKKSGFIYDLKSLFNKQDTEVTF